VAMRLFNYGFFAIAVLLLIFSIISIVWWIFPIDFLWNSQDKSFSIVFNCTMFPYHFHHRAALELFKQHPIVGVGIGSFLHQSGPYINWEQAKASYRVMDPDLTIYYGNPMDPHSTYLGLLAETGVLGLGVTMIFFILFLKKLIIMMHVETDSTKRFILWCFFAGLIGFLWNGIYIEILSMRHFWVLLAMASITMRFPIGSK
jgi:O-antigen ligase